MPVGPGTEIGGYRVEHTIGEGGMAIVHLAERLSDGEPVVLKVLREELVGDPDVRRRFLRESRYAQALDHPSVVRILDAGELGDLLYIVMQHVAGTDLYTLLEEGPLEPGTAVAVLSQVADALDAAHAIGLLHRDVKPGNVLVAVGGDAPPHCLLTDFGLSQRITQDSMALTAPGTFVGTLAYMAPEQMLGDDPGAAVDVYALGCVLFECLAGDPPFTGEPLAVMQAHMESEPPKLAKRGSTLPRAFDAVIAKALAKEPAGRYASCRELLAAAAAALGVALPAAEPARTQTLEPQPPAAPLELLVTAGAAEGTRIAIDGEHLFGRAAPGPGSLGGDLELSRRHALVRAVPGGTLTIEDLGSRNGTYVNGRRIEQLEPVGPGDEISVGASTLVAGAGPAPTAGPAHAGGRDHAAGLAAPRLSLRIAFAPGAGTATLQLDEWSAPIALCYRAGAWRLDRAAAETENPHGDTLLG
ncbi:MAG: FHA domain-containing serine/threonine-protein kinase [Solirubrobacteraceae bacterium]